MPLEEPVISALSEFINETSRSQRGIQRSKPTVFVRNPLKTKSGVLRFAPQPLRPYLLHMGSQVLERRLQAEAIDLSGEWLGFYTGHFDEVVRLTQKGDYVEAVKFTGDEYVPAEEITWRANVRSGHGEGQIAEREFRNSRFVPGRLNIIHPDKIVFTWESCGEVEFRRDD